MRDENRLKRAMQRRAILAGGLGLFAAALSNVAGAQTQPYPSRGIRFIVPFPPGSGTDTSARHYGEKIFQITGQTVTVENKPGANGFLAIQAAKSAPADGYTFLLGTNSTLATNVALFKKLPYDPVTEFEPVAGMLRAPALIIVPPNSPYSSLAKLVEAAKKEPKKLSYGSGSAGYHLMTELFSEKAGIEMTQIPYKGASEAVTAVASSQLDLALVETTSAAALVKAGKIRALAVASEHRSPLMPDVPTATEAGVNGFVIHAWAALMAPTGTPRQAIDKMSEMIQTIAKSNETQQFFSRLNGELLHMNAQELRRFQLEEINRWKRIATAAKVELQ